MDKDSEQVLEDNTRPLRLLLTDQFLLLYTNGTGESSQGPLLALIKGPSQFNSRALLAWETYVNIAKASEEDNKQKPNKQ